LRIILVMGAVLQLVVIREGEAGVWEGSRLLRYMGCGFRVLCVFAMVFVFLFGWGCVWGV